ncbi:FadR/GntR family transcriptional regulator [Lysinibacter cavernae]|uniref:GntR family transcriptional repressor for pyruvate dehydrogenase complex n=1 Tax=Lysinibacter cavernae TaxID=1640652 RepID=A0A7X5QYT1_9MICO|nr:FCD domain-containing protein [Lysinibacter cavernae]NIH52499.1 GntR family transcriptional repressor for pyruvate dehydrogenase complex [Lysinibacter cavernae]
MNTAAQQSPLVEAVLQPVRGHMAFESCVEQLGSAIQLGIFPVGTMLPNERELAERLSVSRATLREAISALRAAGFVSTTRGRGGGTTVELVEHIHQKLPEEREDRRAEIRDTLILRAVIEPGACFQAAQTDLSAVSISLLRTALSEAESADSPAAYRRADARLHLAIASACESAELNKVSSTVQTRLHSYLNEIPFFQANIEHSDEQHREIVEGILAGDGDTARRVMEVHCASTAALLTGLLA